MSCDNSREELIQVYVGIMQLLAFGNEEL